MAQSKLFSELSTVILLFFLIFGMSATVDSENLRRQLRNKYAILIGVGMQFIIMPCLGFLAVYFLQPHGLTTAMGISLLIVTSSPGGSYSNWWCSLFNADLALSVAMTALSTILSIALLPANLMLYAWLAYGLDQEQDILKSINFGKLFVSIATVIVAILLGLFASFKTNSKAFRKWANRLGSTSGILLVLFSALFGSTQSEQNTRIWAYPPAFYIATIIPCLVGLALSNIISSRVARLEKPEVVTLSVECCYQNVGIATSAAVSMFETSAEISQALAVPLVYGLVEAVVLAAYCTLAWKLGWTKAPKEEAFCTMLCKTYEFEEADISSSDQACEVACQYGDEEKAVVQALSVTFDSDSEEALSKCKERTRKNTDSTGEMSAPEMESARIISRIRFWRRGNIASFPVPVPDTLNGFEQTVESDHKYATADAGFPMHVPDNLDADT